MLPANALLSQVDTSAPGPQTHLAQSICISSLPPEIMSAIFIRCLPTVRKGRDAVNIAEVPLLLSQVCSHWRQIALSAPTLWKDLDIRLEYFERKQAANMVETWLARARNCPLSVTFQGSTRHLVDSESTRFFEMFCRHASAMKSLRLENIDTGDWKRMEEPIEFPLLRNLTILPSGNGRSTVVSAPDPYHIPKGTLS
ncbi:hypothetical protein FB45DRAFT_827949 [Roridomyces roridus]|uniref:F-box domain-containing protein n=1 Tax=Roridomyces roridus TaxID=1738132 RepID=A0AAD7C521_9AGAR|nr:hypothetical protein FB45DRAFT_827949 [Roridomyces roridus]